MLARWSFWALLILLFLGGLFGIARVWLFGAVLVLLIIDGLIVFACRARETFERIFFWAVVVVVAGFMASGLGFLVRRAVVGSFISG